MSKRPAYLKSKESSYWIMSALLAVLIWVVYGYAVSDIELQSLVDKSELKGRTFQGKVEDIFLPESKIAVYFMHEDETPLVAISFIFDKAGTAYDPQEKQGLAVMAAATLEQGADGISADKLREEMQLNGIKLSFEAEKDLLVGKITAPRQNIWYAAELLKLILAKPQFEKKYVEATRDQILQTLAAEQESSQTQLKLALNHKIYGDHPYGRNPLGTRSTVERIKRSDLRQFAKDKLAKNNLYVGVAGSLDKTEAADLVNKIFGDLPDEAMVEDIAEVNIDWQQAVDVIQRNDGQKFAMFAAASTCRKCDDFYALYIANYLFGGAGLNSRINQEMREKEGLTYGGYSAMTIGDKSNLILAGFSSSKDKYDEAKKIFLQEWQKVREKGFDEAELQAAKDYLTASYNLRFASTIQIADMLAYMQKYDLGSDFLQKRNTYVESVTKEELNQAAGKYFNNNLLQAEIGNFE